MQPFNTGSLAGDVARRLGTVLMKLLRARAMGYLTFTEQRSVHPVNKFELHIHYIRTAHPIYTPNLLPIN